MIWRIRGRDFDLARRGMIMGVLNVTPDSFSDGGCFLDPEAATLRALRLVEEGADIVDIGGESTRPGSAPVGVDEEIRRVLPVVERLRGRTEALLSIDTSKAQVARAALEASADIVNDVTGLRDPEMAAVCAAARAGVVLMHMQGTPQTMQKNPTYGDVVGEVRDFFRHALADAVASGLDPMSIALDPGIGFGKTFDHNRELLRALPLLSESGRPLLIGVSRKSFLGRIAESDAIADRHWPGIALTSFCRERGARILRVHDVKPHREALRMTEAIIGDD
jgi:dihydropteroate synthase